MTGNAGYRLAGAVVLALLTAGQALAQSPRRDAPSKAQPRPVLQYVYFSPATLGGLPVEGWVRELRQGRTVIEAQLEMCFLADPPQRNRDRLAIPLTISGDRFTGQGTSISGAQALRVDLVRRISDDAVVWTGRVASTMPGGQQQEQVFISTGSFELDDQGFRDGEAADPGLLTHAETTLAAAPSTIRITAPRDRLGMLDPLFKAFDLTVSASFFVDDCADLRRGHISFDVSVHPFRRDEALRALKSHPAVKTAGLTAQDGESLSAIRFPAERFRDADKKPDLPAVAAIFKAAAEIGMGTVEVSHDEKTAGFLVDLRLPSRLRPGFDAIDRIALAIVLYPDPENPDRMVIGRTETTTRIVSPLIRNSGRGAGPVYEFDADAFIVPFWQRLARALDGEVAADDGSEIWRKP